MLKSIQAYFKSYALLKQHGLRWLLWFPTIITVGVFYGGIELTSWATDAATASLRSWIDGIEWLGNWQSTLGSIIYWLLWIVLRIMLYFVFTFVGGSVILILMTPVLTYASEAVAQKMGNEVPPFILSRFFADIARAVGIALKNGLIQLLLTLVCFAIGFIPIVGFAAPVIMFLINAYYYGFSLMDYSMERKALTVNQSASFVWKNRLMSLGIGTPFALWVLIPFIGPMTSGFMALFGTIAATERLEGSPTSPMRIDR
ncbi:MAG: EI24 domain-containing protein [Salibacteraceae bacterium]